MELNLLDTVFKCTLQYDTTKFTHMNGHWKTSAKAFCSHIVAVRDRMELSVLAGLVHWPSSRGVVLLSTGFAVRS